tara:strand:+ start:17841 stop:18266 length:426 start_codon:yes stop_codon:yes gene_type:complete
MRQTSIQCYHQIKREGLLSKRRIQVLESLLAIGQCTAGELERHINSNYNVRGGWKQLSILREQGVVQELGTRPCTITGRNVIEWDMTGNLPVKPKKTKKPSNLNKCIDYIIAGMDVRGWDTVSKDVLTKLKTNGTKTKKAT